MVLRNLKNAPVQGVFTVLAVWGCLKIATTIVKPKTAMHNPAKRLARVRFEVSKHLVPAPHQNVPISGATHQNTSRDSPKGV